MKVKNKKSNLAEMFANRRNKTESKKSPFEMHINRSKQTVLGRKLKADHGLPGVSRSRAITKRKQTLLQEFKIKDKDNIFYDKRIGEKNKNMTEEEKTMRRFVAERVNRNKKSIYNLNDDDILTHRGQSLMDIEKYDQPMKSDESDSEDDSGRLDSNFVDEAHFGGGLFEKNTDEKMSHKDLIDTLIAESKKRKAEKRKMKEQTMDLTEKLDAQWRDLAPLLTAAQKTDEDKEREKGKMDDYDKLVLQMKCGRKAVAGEKLKSEEDMEKEEREKKEKLEKERLMRMEDEEEKKVETKHKSADDLDFDYLVEKVGSENEGEDLSEREDEENKEEEVNEGSGDEENEENAGEEEEVEDEEEESEDEDDLADLKESSSEEDEEEEEEPKIEVQTLPKPTPTPTEEIIIKTEEPQTSVPSSKFNNLKKTYDMPKNLKDLEITLGSHNLDEKSEIISRIIKGNEKTSGYKEQFGQLFGILLQYLDERAKVETIVGVNETFQIYEMICSHLYKLSHVNPEEAAETMKSVLKTKYEDFEVDEKKYPGLETIIVFKVASLIFPSSDFRHPVMTPCHLFMEQILLRCKIKTRSDLAKGVFLCTILLENTLLSKRFVPAVINFLRGVLFCSLENSFKKKSVDVSSLKLQKSDLISDDKIDDNFKLRLVSIAVQLLNDFIDLLQGLEAAYALFKPIQKIFNLELLNKFPKEVRKLGEEVKEKIKIIENKELEYLVLPKKKPKSLKLYEAKIEPVYEGKRNRPESRELAERQKMIHKLKMETKNAKREIRRDNAFLTKVKISQQIKSDEERKRKVKELFADAAMQQSELKKWKKK